MLKLIEFVLSFYLAPFHRIISEILIFKEKCDFFLVGGSNIYDNCNVKQVFTSSQRVIANFLCCGQDLLSHKFLLVGYLIQVWLQPMCLQPMCLQELETVQTLLFNLEIYSFFKKNLNKHVDNLKFDLFLHDYLICPY